MVLEVLKVEIAWEGHGASLGVEVVLG